MKWFLPNTGRQGRICEFFKGGGGGGSGQELSKGVGWGSRSSKSVQFRGIFHSDKQKYKAGGVTQ